MRKCQICEKGSRMVGARKLLRGHYNPVNWSRKYPNLQKFTTKDGSTILACTSCIRTESKEARMADLKEKRAAAKALAAEKRERAAAARAAKEAKSKKRS
ncbi:MAG: hypothetical protein R3B52_00070 [Candidatus Paceibacterota bacterium]